MSLIFLSGCNQYSSNKSSKLDLKLEKKYNNTGFSLIYNEDLDLKKLDNRSLQIFHKNLKNNHLLKLLILQIINL